MFYLLRLEPFTSMSIDLQNGKFDVPDRIFGDIEKTWESSGGNIDGKELTPEWFFLPDFLRNR